MKRSVTDIKLTVKPVFIGFEHQYYYEGPCRMAGGDAIKPGFDAVVQGKMLKGFLANVNKYVASTGANVLEPAIVRGTDDWDIKDSYFEEMLADDQKTDLYVVMSNFGANQILVEFCCRTSKPVVMNPTKSFGAMSTAPAQRRGADILPAFDWPEVSRYCSILRAEKAVRTANILLAPRFDSTTPKAGGNDSFTCLSDVTRQLGCHFRHVNVHELMDMMNPLPEEGNATTPGRATPNITPEEVARCEEMADEMVASADPCIVDKGFLVKSLVAWTVVQKLMDLYDCSGFTAPCPDACSTRRLNEQQFTFCLAHSLNLEQGFGSACEYDITSVVCMIAEMALSNSAAYMGNTLPVVVTEGRIEWPVNVHEEDVAGISLEDAANMYSVIHSTPCRKLHGLEAAADAYALRHFAYDQGFGAIQRHDFTADAGQKITLCRISPNLDEMLIVSGEIVTGTGFDTDNCNGGFVFKVADTRDLFKKQMRFGLHLPLVYGDIADDLEELAKRLGMEPVRA